MANGKSASIQYFWSAQDAVRTFRALPEDLQHALDETSRGIATRTAGLISAAAAGESRQAAMVAPSIYAKFTGIPTVVAGGGMKVAGKPGLTSGDIFFGANFGSYMYNQFPDQKIGDDYFFYDTLYGEAPRMVQEWSQAIADVAEVFNAGGD